MFDRINCIQHASSNHPGILRSGSHFGNSTGTGKPFSLASSSLGWVLKNVVKQIFSQRLKLKIGGWWRLHFPTRNLNHPKDGLERSHRGICYPPTISLRLENFKVHCVNSYGDTFSHNESGSMNEWKQQRFFWWHSICQESTRKRALLVIFRLSIMFIVFVIPFVGTLLFYLRIICRIRQTYAELMGLAAQV